MEKIPRKTLIPSKIKNLLKECRCENSDRMANSALRVQASCMGMGQAAAVAAFLAHKMNVSPEDIPATEVCSELEKHGAIVPD